MSEKIFISHQSASATIASKLSELITYSFVLSPENVICTSAEVHGLQNANDSYHQIKQSIGEAVLVIYLLSKEFCESEDCMYEAAWGYDKKEKFLIHLDGVKSKNKPKLFENLSMNELDEQGLTSLKTKLICKLERQPTESIWAKHQKELLEIRKEEEILSHSNGRKQNAISGNETLLRILEQAIDFCDNVVTEFWNIEQMHHALGVGKAIIEKEIKTAITLGYLMNIHGRIIMTSSKFRVTDAGIDYVKNSREGR